MSKLEDAVVDPLLPGELTLILNLQKDLINFGDQHVFSHNSEPKFSDCTISVSVDSNNFYFPDYPLNQPTKRLLLEKSHSSGSSSSSGETDLLNDSINGDLDEEDALEEAMRQSLVGEAEIKTDSETAEVKIKTEIKTETEAEAEKIPKYVTHQGLVDCQSMDFPVHRFMLAARSEYFRTMLSIGMSEEKNKKIIITDIHPFIMREIIIFIYTGNVSAVVNWGLMGLELLRAADRCMMPNLIKYCCFEIRYVLQENPNCDQLVFDLLDSLALLIRPEIEDLKEECMKTIVENFEHYSSNPRFEELDRDILTKIISISLKHNQNQDSELNPKKKTTKRKRASGSTDTKKRKCTKSIRKPHRFPSSRVCNYQPDDDY